MRKLSLIILGIAVLVVALPGQTSGPAQLPKNPMSGRIVFEEKGCIKCHAINGYGGDVGPDLGRDKFYGSFYDLASRMWNHAPAMIVQSGASESDWSMLMTTEVDRLIAFLFYLRYLGEPGNVAEGRQLLKTKNCLKCHTVEDEGAKGGLPLDELTAFASPLYMAQVIWNHGPEMQSEMKALGITRPKFEDQTITDISAYLRELSRTTASGRQLMSPGDPNVGAAIFSAKGCQTCHPSGDGAGGEVPLGEMDLHRSVTAIAGTMWNHGDIMQKAMEERKLSWPTFDASEMADLLAFMYFNDYQKPGGDATWGGALFAEKSCERCHDSAADVMEGSEFPLETPSDLIRTMWNHVPHMHKLVLSRNIPWPELTPDELRNLYTYLLSHSD